MKVRHVFRSTRRIAFTARHVTSRTRNRISTGSFPKGAEVPIIRTCKPVLLACTSIVLSFVAFLPAPAAAQGATDATFVRARLADAEGDARTALSGYAAVLATVPDSTVVASRTYREALVVGDYALAGRAADVLAGSETAPADVALFQLIRAIASNDRRSIDAYLELVGRGPFEFMVPSMRAWIALEHGQDPLPLLAPEGASQLSQRFSAEQRALILLEMGRTDEGLDQARQLATKGELVQELRNDAALILARQGRWDLADAVLGGQGPSRAALRQLLRRQRAAGARLGISRMFVRLAFDLTHEEPGPLSVVVSRVSLMLDPMEDRARLYLADALSEMGDADVALSVLREVTADSPYGREARIVGARALNRAGRVEEALAAARSLSDERLATAEDAIALGELLSANGRAEDAVEAYATAIQRSGSRAGWSLYVAYGNALDDAGRWDDALVALREAVRRGQSQPGALYALASAALERNYDIPGTVTLLERANSLRPGDAAITDALGWAYYKNGDYARALPLIEQAAQAQDSDWKVNERLGDVYWRVGRLYEARYAWRAAMVFASAEDVARLETKLRDGLPTVSATH